MDYLREVFYNLKKEFTPKCLRQLSHNFILFRKPRLILWLVINYLAFWFNDTNIFLIITTITIYIIVILIALSGLAERLFRILEDVRRVATQTEKERLLPLFEEVYINVQNNNDSIGTKVKLYIIDTMVVNAVAIGKNTIVITRGLMSTMSDEEIKAILAHEFAHIINGDTQVSIIVTMVMHIYMWGAFLFSKAVYYTEKLAGAGSAISSVLSFIRILIEMAVKYLLFIITAIASSSSRKREYKADMYASKLGYKEQLISALYKLYDMQISDKQNLIQKMQADHPKVAYRIEQLESQ